MPGVAPTKPTLELLRTLSDEHVLRALMSQRHATRSELATADRPVQADRLRERPAAERERLRHRHRGAHDRARPGRQLLRPARHARDARWWSASRPEGIVAEAVDVYGDVVARSAAPVSRAPGAGEVARTLRSVAGEVGGPFRLAVVSAADPVDRETGRLVELPDAPFLLGALDAPAVLADLVDGPVTVDNDVNWAARAELGHAGVRDFVYLFLGEGLGCAVLSDGDVRRGHTGVAGEIAHMVTVGPDGAAMRLTDVFAALGLRRAGSTAIDSAALLERVDTTADALGRAVAGVLSAVVALADPAVVLIGGSWGRDPRVLEAVAREFAGAPRSVPVRAAAIEDEPALAAARETALVQLRDAIVASAS